MIGIWLTALWADIKATVCAILAVIIALIIGAAAGAAVMAAHIEKQTADDAADMATKAAQTLTESVAAARQAQAAADAIQTQNAVSAVADRVRIVTRTQILIRKVPAYVTPKADAGCVVTAGFVRVHDAAASGAGLPDADDRSVADDAPSGVALSAIAETVAGNYGVCAANASQLIHLQDAVSAFQKTQGTSK